MNRLDDVVLNYLKMDTHYAIMITGEWGVGKTYYFEKNLRNKIANTPVFNDHQKKYIPVLISLFGLKSIEEIQVEILLALYPIFKTSKFKLGATVGKILIKGFLHLKGLGEYSNLVEEIKVDKKSLINIEELVLCFDDLERINQDLNMEELVGYINSLVETLNVKILIITNEGKITEQNFTILKEKVVGNSIEFIPDIENTYDSVISENFAGYPSFKKFLQINKQSILIYFTRKSSNFRTFIFALNHFHIIFSEINNKLLTENKLKEIQQEILLDLLKFTLAISNEYKLGKISYKHRHGLDMAEPLGFDIPLSSKEIMGLSEKGKSEPSYSDQLIQTYYFNERFNYYGSIYDYITGGSTFNIDMMLDELKKAYHLDKDGVSPQYEVFNSLNYENCFTLSNKEYKILTRKMLSFAKLGKYDIDLYLTIFHFALRFNNPLNLSPDKLEKTIINGMIKGKKTTDISERSL
jgi:hypothetical protein